MCSNHNKSVYLSGMAFNLFFFLRRFSKKLCKPCNLTASAFRNSARQPSLLLSLLPSIRPSLLPSFLPSLLLSLLPSQHLSILPSLRPSLLPSLLPFFLPSPLLSLLSSLRASVCIVHCPVNSDQHLTSILHQVITETRRYSLLRGLSSSSCRGLRPSAKVFFCPLGKKRLYMPFLLILGNFWCSVVTSVTFISNLR